MEFNDLLPILVGAFFIFVAIAMLFVKTDEEQTEKLAKVFPGAYLVKHRWFRWVGALFLIVIGLISLGNAFKFI